MSVEFVCGIKAYAEVYYLVNLRIDERNVIHVSGFNPAYKNEMSNLIQMDISMSIFNLNINKYYQILAYYANTPVLFQPDDSQTHNSGKFNVLFNTYLYCTIGNHSLSIPIIELTHPYKCLPYTYYLIHHPAHNEYTSAVHDYLYETRKYTINDFAVLFSSIGGNEDRLYIRPTNDIICRIIESCFYRRESCPITMELLNEENTCICPCHHCFDVEALRQSYRVKKECPLCRSEFKWVDVAIYKECKK